LLADDGMRSAFGAAGVHRAEAYGWSRVAAATERVYLRSGTAGSAPASDRSQLREVVG
jgi:hypothetical protein